MLFDTVVVVVAVFVAPVVVSSDDIYFLTIDKKYVLCNLVN